jgi:GTP-binding protein
MTDFSLEEGADRFQRVLEASGISARLDELGIEPGDVVHIADGELVWEADLVEAGQERPAGRVRKTRRQRTQVRLGQVAEVDELDEDE